MRSQTKDKARTEDAAGRQAAILRRGTYRPIRFAREGRSGRYRGRDEGIGMKEPLPIRAMDAMEAGIKTARQNPKDGTDPTPDDYIAWCIWNALRLAGLKIIDVEEQSEN
jgi:hypothetical protein